MLRPIRFQVNGEVSPRTGHEGSEEEQRYNSTLSLTTALDWGGTYQIPACLNLDLNWNLWYIHAYVVDHMYIQFWVAQNLTCIEPSGASTFSKSRSVYTLKTTVTYSTAQCAAVKTHSSEIREPPQKAAPSEVSIIIPTWCGNWWRTASCPPVIREPGKVIVFVLSTEN
jgi:hypothetical protein